MELGHNALWHWRNVTSSGVLPLWSEISVSDSMSGSMHRRGSSVSLPIEGIIISFVFVFDASINACLLPNTPSTSNLLAARLRILTSGAGCHSLTAVAGTYRRAGAEAYPHCYGEHPQMSITQPATSRADDSGHGLLKQQILIIFILSLFISFCATVCEWLPHHLLYMRTRFTPDARQLSDTLLFASPGGYHRRSADGASPLWSAPSSPKMVWYKNNRSTQPVE